MERVTLHGLIVDVNISQDGNWKKDVVIIHAAKKYDENKTIKVMEYLYAEGFIKDRRTLYLIKRV